MPKEIGTRSMRDTSRVPYGSLPVTLVARAPAARDRYWEY
jgi:hypothetical protein